MPLATMRTSTSSPRGSDSSRVSMTNGPDCSRTTAAVICILLLPLSAVMRYRSFHTATSSDRREPNLPSEGLQAPYPWQTTHRRPAPVGGMPGRSGGRLDDLAVALRVTLDNGVELL